jgi:hypothetical protein
MKLDTVYERITDHLGCLGELVMIEDGRIAYQDMDCGLLLFDLTPENTRLTGECEGCKRPLIEYCPDCDGGHGGQMTLGGMVQ